MGRLFQQEGQLVQGFMHVGTDASGIDGGNGLDGEDQAVPEIVHIQGGQCGNQIGAKFWEVRPGATGRRVDAPGGRLAARRDGEAARR